MGTLSGAFGLNLLLVEYRVSKTIRLLSVIDHCYSIYVYAKLRNKLFFLNNFVKKIQA